MRPLTLFITLLAIFGLTSTKKVVTCYYDASGSYWNGHDKGCNCWKDEAKRYEVKDIDTTHCTHLIYSFAHLDTTSWNIVPNSEYLDTDKQFVDKDGNPYKGLNNYEAFTNLKLKGVKTLLAIGGKKDCEEKYSKVSKYSYLVSQPNLRKIFNTQALSFLKTHNFDGLDLDWEFPGNTKYGGQTKDKANFATWVQELKEAFKGDGLLLTAAVGNPGDKGYKYADLYKDLDYVHLMSYDFHGWWKGDKKEDNKKALHNAPMSETKKLVETWTTNSKHTSCLEKDKICPYKESDDKICPMDKLVLGVALYGRSYKLKDKSQNKPSADVTGPGNVGTYPAEEGLLSYLDICTHIKCDTNEWENIMTTEDVEAYATYDNQWVGYDDVTLVEKKAQFVNRMGLAGVLVWSIDYADWNGVCGDKYPLVTAMSNKLSNIKAHCKKNN